MMHVTVDSPNSDPSCMDPKEMHTGSFDIASPPFSSATSQTDPTSESKSVPTSSTKKKRKSWGQILPEPTTNLPPRKRAKTAEEKQQRLYERVQRNRQAAHNSRMRKQDEMERAQHQNQQLMVDNEALRAEIRRLNDEVDRLTRMNKPQPSSPVTYQRPLTPPNDLETYPSPPSLTSGSSLEEDLSPPPPQSQPCQSLLTSDAKLLNDTHSAVDVEGTACFDGADMIGDGHEMMTLEQFASDYAPVLDDFEDMINTDCLADSSLPSDSFWAPDLSTFDIEAPTSLDIAPFGEPFVNTPFPY